MPNVSEHTRSFWQNLRTKRIFLACSGGVDSMVLLHCLNALKVDLTVIHVNYQLRDEDSNQDAALVRKVCEQFDIPFEIRIVDLKTTLGQGGNLQDEARKVRYDWFNEILVKDTNNIIALAHHQNDQVETFLMNLSRKSGVLGLACMKKEHNGIVRPLLDFSKAELLKYASNNSIEWREDRSNRSNNYTRNRLRNEFIPFLKLEIEQFDSSVLTLIHSFQRKQLELEQEVSAIVRSIFDTYALPIKNFEALGEYEQVELLRQLKISASYLPRILDLKERGKRIDFTNSKFESIVLDENQFTFLRSENQSFKLQVAEVDLLPDFFDKDQAYFDASKIEGELKIRTWKVGDRISPIGMKGSQLLSDIIKDAKITADAKRNQLIVHDDNAILWCVGLKISKRAVADSYSEKILQCSVIVLKEEESEVR